MEKYNYGYASINCPTQSTECGRLISSATVTVRQGRYTSDGSKKGIIMKRTIRILFVSYNNAQ